VSSILTRTETVTVADGSFVLRVWSPGEPAPGVLVLQEIFGVGEYIEDVCHRLAEAGYVAAAPDVFWRFAPGWRAAHDEAGMNASFQQVQQLDFPLAIADSAAALLALGDLSDVAGRPAVLGFCLGGTLAWGVAAAADPSCCVSYYGSGVPSMLDLADSVRCPVLFHFGANDEFIPSEGVEAVNQLVGSHRNLTLNVELAGHAFDNHAAPMFHEPAAASAAWSKTLAFLETNLPR
jgi:carboxymethylenebutenolidase